MNINIKRLAGIASKKTRRILGLMSGTSLDGLDIAVCKVTGSGFETQVEVEHFATIPYSSSEKNNIRQVFANKNADIETLCLLNGWIARLHSGMIHKFLEARNIISSTIDLIASHGQTIYHAPLHQHNRSLLGNGTLQLGDGDHIAVKTGIITISDFRQKHVAAGGEGAPLAAYGDMLLFGGQSKPTIMLNIGGISNFTYLPPKGSKVRLTSTDTGPGNTLMNYWANKTGGFEYDKDGMLAKAGIVYEPLLNALMDNDFFRRPFPKSTGPELFNENYLQTAIRKSTHEHIEPADVMATLNRFTAESIIKGIKHFTTEKADIYVTGGGLHNITLMDHIARHLPGEIKSTMSKGIPPDAKEAVLFAILANETIAGDPLIYPYTPAITMGKISLPG